MDAPTIVSAIGGSIFFVAYLLSIVWAGRDANARGKSGCLVAFLVWLFWPLSLLVWIVSRPKHDPTKLL